MKRMTELIFTAGFALVAAVLLCACSDKLDIQQVYEFDLATLPVQSTIVEGGKPKYAASWYAAGGTRKRSISSAISSLRARGSFVWRTARYCCPMTFIRCRARPSGSITGRSAPTSRRLTSTLWIRLTRR